MAASVGVKVAVNVCGPAFRIVPMAGLYEKAPSTLLVALS